MKFYYTANNDLPGPKLTPGPGSSGRRRDRFHLPHHFDRLKGQVPALSLDRGGIGGEGIAHRPLDHWDCSRSAEERKGWSDADEIRRTGRRVDVPNWIKRDKQVLRFNSYFVESASLDEKDEASADRDEESKGSTIEDSLSTGRPVIAGERVRRCHIFYFLEDDTIKVVEPVVHNSGIPQGTLVRRHRVPYTYDVDPSTGQLLGPSSRTFPQPYITHYDLNLRKDLIVYGRRHRLVDCDAFTRSYLEDQLGVSVPPSEPEPEDGFAGERHVVEATAPLRPYKRVAPPKHKFEPGPPRILRFFGKWVDGREGQGRVETRWLAVHFYLEDGTMEMVEEHDKNCGRYKAPIFLKRCKLPKSVTTLVTPPGHGTDHTLLNVVRSKGPGRIRDAVLIDNLETREDTALPGTGLQEDNQFHPEDFEIGQKIQIGGRDILLYDCDEFTRRYYAENHNRDMEAVEREARPSDGPPSGRRNKGKQFPPYNGFGTEEDSKTSCDGLEPRPPQRDFYKFMNRDRDGFESYILRFSARLIENDKVEATRKFVISYFLSDDTILVNQLSDINSGRSSGRFLQRCRVKKPREYQSENPAEDSLFYTSHDLYVGAIVRFNEHVFLVTDADDYVFAFMERYEEREKYPHSNIRLVLEKLDKTISKAQVKTLMSRFMEEDQSLDEGRIAERMFRIILRDFIGFELSEHEIITLTRHFRAPDARQERLPEETLFALLQNELKRMQFTSFAEILATFQGKDIEGKGLLPKSVVRHTLVSAFAATSKTTLKNHAIRELVDKALVTYGDDNSVISYEDALNKLNWVRNPSQPIPPRHVPSNFYEYPLQNELAPILYRDFIQSLEEKKGVDTTKKINEIEEEIAAKEDNWPPK